MPDVGSVPGGPAAGGGGLQGADRVNGELEVGYDEHFERRWEIAEHVGRYVMLAFVGVVLAGLLGRGPFSHHRAQAEGSGLSVDYEPVARVQTETQITLHYDNDSARDTVEIMLPTTLVEPMGLQRILPRPLVEHVAGNGLVLTFAMPPGTRDGHVRLIAQPVGVGAVALSAQLAGHPAVHWTQVVAP